jgi:hypothetical protein
MKFAADYSRQSDPDLNRQFRRRWTETPIASRVKPEPIKLIEIPYALNAEGSPRAALLVPPMPAALDRHPVRRVFDSLGAAIAAKRMMEASQ